jgi:hypothetical protein
MYRTAQPVYFVFMAVLGLVLMSSCSSPTATLTTKAISPTATESILPTATTQEAKDSEVRTGVDELDRVIQIVLDGDTIRLRSIIQFTRVGCTFEDGLGGPPKCEDDEVEDETVEVLPFLGPEGHFLRMENIGSWTGIDASDLYAVYVVSDSAYSDPIYPSGKYAIAFINEAQFLITTLQIVEGQIVRVDSTLGNPPTIRPDDVGMYLIAPRELD